MKSKKTGGGGSYRLTFSKFEQYCKIKLMEKLVILKLEENCGSVLSLPAPNAFEEGLVEPMAHHPASIFIWAQVGLDPDGAPDRLSVSLSVL